MGKGTAKRLRVDKKIRGGVGAMRKAGWQRLLTPMKAKARRNGGLA
ncbi:hypothetical protein [Paraburkholderia sp.]